MPDSAIDANETSKVVVVYDKQCPACDFYCNLARIRESVGHLELVINNLEVPGNDRF